MIKYLKRKSKEAYKVDGVENLDEYISDRYGEEFSLSKEKTIKLNKYTNRSLEAGVGNCTLVSIVRILEYFRGKGYNNIPENREKIYEDLKCLSKKYLYRDKNGTLPIMISSIYEGIIRYYDYNAYSRASFFWDFDDHIKREIDLNYPVIFNIARGYYKNHTVVISGYKIYRSINNKRVNIIIIHDGWKKEPRFINFNQFEKNLLFAGLGSFNNIRIL